MDTVDADPYAIVDIYHSHVNIFLVPPLHIMLGFDSYIIISDKLEVPTLHAPRSSYKAFCDMLCNNFNIVKQKYYGYSTITKSHAAVVHYTTNIFNDATLCHKDANIDQLTNGADKTTH